MIFLFTSPVQSGKTTSLTNWSSGRKDVYGILTPVVGGTRYFMDAHTREQWPMEAKRNEKDTLIVGKFVFSKAGFNKAIAIIQKAIPEKGWLVIDEVGPLELKGEGFCAVLKEVLQQRSPTENMILVVRKGLAEEVKKYFVFTSTDINDITGLSEFN